MNAFVPDICLHCSYSGARKGEAMLEYIQQKVEEDKGFARVEVLDSLAQQFRNAPDLSTLVSQLTEKAGALTDQAQKSAGDLYVKYGQKATEKVFPISLRPISCGVAS